MPLVLQAGALLGMYFFGESKVVATGLSALAGLAFSAFASVVGARVLQVAPGHVDVAGAGSSTAFNVGITAGALLGSVLLTVFDVRATALAGGLLTLVAVAVALAEPRRAPAERAGVDSNAVSASIDGGD